MDDFSQFKATYINECFELLADMEEKLMGLDASADKETLNAIFRCAHSIKGGAGAFGFTNIASFTHILEALLDKMREGEIAPNSEIIDALLKARDVVFQMVSAAQANTTLPENYGKDILDLLVSFTPGQQASVVQATKHASVTTVGKQCYTIAFTPHRTMIANGNEPLLLLRELASLGDAEIQAHIQSLPELPNLEVESCYIGWTIALTTEKPESAIREVFEFVDGECDLTIRAAAVSAEVAPAAKPEVALANSATTPAPANVPAPAAAATPQVSSIRVDVDKVDRLINMVGEVVITQSFLAAQMRSLPTAAYADLIRGVEDMSHHIRELQEAVMAVRMQPVKSIFSRFPRLVRDLSGQLGKDIHLEMVGENTEVDKTIIEQLADPLTHMIRNSVDHGVEKPEIRLERGKSTQGTIKLSAEHRGGRIVIQIADDGGGINREKVLQKAREKGLVPMDVTPADVDIDMLIFAPGFSTADTVTNVSGRGVGMDVVRRNIEGIGGVVSVQNTPLQGSIFSISLPLTLAILDGMIVRCGQEFYIIPIGSIVETMRPKPHEVQEVAGNGSVINVRGEFISILYLHRVFHVRDAERDPSKGLIVLVENGSTILGLMVDELVGQQQVVIKSLEENSDPIPGVSGATILGDGKVSLILDIAQLHEISKRDQNAANDNQTTPLAETA